MTVTKFSLHIGFIISFVTIQFVVSLNVPHTQIYSQELIQYQFYVKKIFETRFSSAKSLQSSFRTRVFPDLLRNNCNFVLYFYFVSVPIKKRRVPVTSLRSLVGVFSFQNKM